MAEFTGLVAAVTGGASGIGLATAKLLAERGARVAVLDIAPNELPDGIDGIVCDVTSRETIAAAIQTIRDQLGGLDILVNNAGISAVGTVEDNDDAEWARVLDVNVIGMARVTAAALPLLRASDAAAVVNLCSSRRSTVCHSARSMVRRKARFLRSPSRWPRITCAKASESTA